MKRQLRYLILVLVVTLIISVGGAWAAGSFEIPKHVIAGGGARRSAGNFTLEGTVGQPVAGIDSHGDDELCSGYWCGSVTYEVYLPLTLRD